MSTDVEIKARFWKELKRDRTVMLGLDGAREGRTQPMTALIEGEEGGPLWFFTARDNGLVEALGRLAPGDRHLHRQGPRSVRQHRRRAQRRQRPGDDRAAVESVGRGLVRGRQVRSPARSAPARRRERQDLAQCDLDRRRDRMAARPRPQGELSRRRSPRCRCDAPWLTRAGTTRCAGWRGTAG